MIRILTSLCLTAFCVGSLFSQTIIGGQINSYAKVTAIDNSDVCAPFITVDDASAYADGDYLMLIQMKGAEIDTTNTSAFGNITNLNGAGLYEKTQIDQIVGNDIYLVNQIANNYDIASKVQVVNILQYSDAEVSSLLVPMLWDGDKGGIIALEVQNILTLNANINANFAGFKGGISDNQPTSCNWTSSHQNYYYPDNSPLGDTKGEGIAEFYVGKENGRGPQGTGGGGGNDHNSGGGGGSNFGIGGAGGQNLNPIPLQCLGQYPGLGGYAVSSFGDRLFLGGGGGTGHSNNGTGSDGGDGGGIIYIKANIIQGNWNTIAARGKEIFPTIAQDGAGGGGGGGTILVDANALMLGLTLSAAGGNGGDSNVLNTNNCMGPGGGGGGGVVFTSLSSPTLFTNTTGGQAGVVSNSTNSCNGQSLGATGGTAGLVLGFPGLTEGNIIEHIAFDSNPTDATICSSDMADFGVITDLVADSYQWQIDIGSGFTNLNDGSNASGTTTDMLSVGNLAPGVYAIQCIATGGCNDVITSDMATLEVLAAAMVTASPEDQVICEGELFVLMAEADGTNVNYQWQVDDGSGFVDIVNNAQYSGGNSNTLSIQADANMQGYQFQCVVNNDCPGTDVSNIATISIDPLPIADFTFYVSGDTVFVDNASTGADSYYWDFGVGEPLEPGNAPYHIFEEDGTYFITIYAVNDCGTTSVTYPVDIMTTSIFDTQISPLDFIISPNPAYDFMQLDLSAETFKEALVRIYDIRGQLIYNRTISDSILLVDVSNFAAGTYLVQVSIDGKSFTKKVVKR